MGKITIQISGSFQPNDTVQFSAMKHGHTTAIMEAIEWLQNYALPSAILQDVSLKNNGYLPEEGFNVRLVERELPCPNCGQILVGDHGGEYPCPICCVPICWDSAEESSNGKNI